MPKQSTPSLARFGSMVALALALAGCTKGGQFDPTSIFDNDMFVSKKPLAGQREPLFPNGVPGATTGVPPDLVKGYQPPPDQAADNVESAPAAAAAPPPKPKPKPKPQVARAPAPGPQDKAFEQKPPTRVSIGVAPKPAASAQKTDSSSQPPWPAPAQTQQAAGASPSPWPASPQQGAQPAPSAWPNPPATTSH